MEFLNRKRLLFFEIFVCIVQIFSVRSTVNKSDKSLLKPFLPISHSSGVFEDTSFFAGAKPLYKPTLRKQRIISRSDVVVDDRDVRDYECAQYHRYCSYEDIQRNMSRLQEKALLTDLKRHSPYYCSCSKDCIFYGDCCWNAPISSANNSNAGGDGDDEEEEKAVVNYKCIDMKENNYYYMWSKCPVDWIIEDIKAQCEDDHENRHTGSRLDGLLLMPVTSLTSNITYKNIFCAVCNKEKQLLPWKLNLECNPNTSQIEINPQITKMCPFHFSFPDTMETMLEDGMIFPCENNVIGSYCENTNATMKVVDDLNAIKCERYFAPVIGNATGYMKSYKNKFCAFCNGESPQNLKCQTGTERNTPLRILYGFGHKVKTSSMPSFSMLLDIDFSTGGSVVGSTTRCPPGSVYDPWTEDCRGVVCGQSYVYSEGICIAKPKEKEPIDDVKSKPISTTKPSLMDVCPKLPVSDEYDLDENETIVFHRNKMVFKKGEYKIEGNGTVMICVNASTKYMEKFSQVQSILTIVCISISLICLLLKMVLHFVVPERKNIAPKVIFNLSLALFVGQLLFVVGAGRPEWGIACTAIAIVTQYAFLCSFFWSNILAYDIWNTFNTTGHPKSHSSNHCAKLTKYSIYAWTTPLLIVLLSALINWLPYDVDEWRPRYGETVCWICNRTALLLFFATPLALLLVVNVVFFASTAYVITRASKAAKMAHENTGKNDQVKLILYVKLAAIMGLTWLFGFVAPFTRSNIVWCFFIVLNGLQGAFLFFAFTKFERVKRKLLNWSQTDIESSATSSKHGNVKKLQFQLSRSSLAASSTNITNV